MYLVYIFAWLVVGFSVFNFVIVVGHIRKRRIVPLNREDFVAAVWFTACGPLSAIFVAWCVWEWLVKPQIKPNQKRS